MKVRRKDKYRAWDLKYNCMYNKVLVGNLDSGEDDYVTHACYITPQDVDYYCAPHWCNFDEHSDIVLMQATGKLDRNNKDIFELDVVEDLNNCKYIVFYNIKKERHEYLQVKQETQSICESFFIPLEYSPTFSWSVIGCALKLYPTLAQEMLDGGLA